MARLAALSWLLVLAGLGVYTVGGWAIGWEPAVVLGGSMSPAIRPGDVVLADPRGLPDVRVGQIVVAHDPNLPGELLTHRVVELRPGGRLVTRGDANRDADTSVLEPQELVGVVRLVVPAAGRAAVLARRPTRSDLTWAGASAGALLLVTVRRPSSARRSSSPRVLSPAGVPQPGRGRHR